MSPSLPAFLLKERDSPIETPTTGDERERTAGGSRIRCPRCEWQPGRRDRWGCVCGHVWNTFDTRGVCPGCGHRWLETQCLQCKAWSPHEDWYVEAPDA